MNEENTFAKNVFSGFINKINITDEFKKSFKIFIEDKNVNDFFDERIQKEFKSLTEEYKDEFYRRYINLIFYECIGDYLMLENKLMIVTRAGKF